MLSKVLGFVGRAFIIVGLFILGFVAFQLWGTSIEEGRNQSELTDRLATSVEDTADVSESDDAGELADALAKALEDQDPATAPATPAPAEGEPVGIIEIPKIGLERVIVQGVTKADLKKGPGHYPGTPLPGQAGNAGIAGHRTTYGAPFNRIDELVPGDEITITTPQGRFLYKVIKAPDSDAAPYIVKPSDVSVLEDKGDNRITLTACHPEYSARERIIVNAVLSAPPAPTSPPSKAVEKAVAASDNALDEGMAGDDSALLPAALLALAALAVGLLAWFVGKRWKRWPMWLLGTPLVLALVWSSYVHLDRYLPSL
ncbi:class E sortase [Dermatobacter hominis]|uniref:class E sortase n=1 Tax=Dermatobacter hominis TaxID=2884263 RepID=UPI001D11A971|nr:class E sortase [Dermatobacter hominis]UDY37289.1 class E sortase [Dermatobacter hominis]